MMTIMMGLWPLLIDPNKNMHFMCQYAMSCKLKQSEGQPGHSIPILFQSKMTLFHSHSGRTTVLAIPFRFHSRILAKKQIDSKLLQLWSGNSVTLVYLYTIMMCNISENEEVEPNSNYSFYANTYNWPLCLPGVEPGVPSLWKLPF